MQATRAYTLPVPAASLTLLLAVWQERRINADVSPADWKRDKGQGRTEQSSTCQSAEVIYTPRPHVNVYLNNNEFLAFIGTGAEVSCIDEDTLALLFAKHKFYLRPATRIKLADNPQGITK